MVEWIEANWIVAGAAVVLALLVIWWLFGRAKPAPVRREFDDVLSEGAAPAQRNTALIDAPPAAAIPAITPPPGVELMAGLGEVVAAAATSELTQVAASAESDADDLSKIKGVGPKLRAALTELGVTRYAQIAAWTDEDIKAIDARLGTFAGRATRDNWVEQCKFLASGDTAGYEAKFGKL